LCLEIRKEMVTARLNCWYAFIRIYVCVTKKAVTKAPALHNLCIRAVVLSPKGLQLGITKIGNVHIT